MRAWLPRGALVWVVVIACYVLYSVTLDSVPFHPDESSWIYMSRDFDALLRRDVGRLVWWSGQAPDGDVGFRLLDAPLAKYQIGLARWVSGYRRELIGNWDWRRSWVQNQSIGAMPSPGLLHAARISAVVTTVLSFALFFWISAAIIGTLPAAAATLLLAIHPIELLHARRAMAESASQLFLMLAMLAIMRLSVSPGAERARSAVLSAGVGLTLGLAVSAKQNASAIVPLGVLAAAAVSVASLGPVERRLTGAIVNAAAVIVTSLLAFFVMNPVMYSQPIHAARDMVTMRRSLVQQQLPSGADTGSQTSIPTRLSRLKAAYNELFWRPPDLGESMTYPEIVPSAREYEQQFLVKVWDATSLRLLFVLFSGLGLGVAVQQIVSRRFTVVTWPLQIAVLWLFAEVAFVMLFIPLDWQRYFLPLLPPVCIFAALGASWSIERVLFRRSAEHS
jgi:4-amino-4-deoxy-L-arabinose transferase-like glycosyltransferase